MQKHFIDSILQLPRPVSTKKRKIDHFRMPFQSFLPRKNKFNEMCPNLSMGKMMVKRVYTVLQQDLKLLDTSSYMLTC